MFLAMIRIWKNDMKFKIRGTKIFSEIVEADDQISAEVLFQDRHHPYLEKIQEVIKIEGKKEKEWIIGPDDEIYPGMVVQSIKHIDALRVLYGPDRDPECLLVDDCGHYHLLDITKGDYKVVSEHKLKHRVVYGAHHEKGPFYVTEDGYWSEQDFKEKHPDKAWGFVKMIPELAVISKEAFNKNSI